MKFIQIIVHDETLTALSEDGEIFQQYREGAPFGAGTWYWAPLDAYHSKPSFDTMAQRLTDKILKATPGFIEATIATGADRSSAKLGFSLTKKLYEQDTFWAGQPTNLSMYVVLSLEKTAVIERAANLRLYTRNSATGTVLTNNEYVWDTIAKEWRLIDGMFAGSDSVR